MQEHEGLFQLDALTLLVIDEVGGQIAAIELHAFDDIQLVVQRGAFLDGNDALLADLLHRLGDNLADRVIRVGGDGTDLGDRLGLGTGLGHGLELLGGRGHSLIDAALEVHRVHASCNGLEALAHHGLGQDGRGGGAVAGDVGGMGGNLLDHLGAHVLELIL